MNRQILVLPLSLVLLAGCVARPLEVARVAPADALTCARAELVQLGYEITGEDGAGRGFGAQRTASSEWVHHIRHQVNVSLRENAAATLHVRARRVEDRIPGRDAPQRRVEDRPSSRVVSVDDTLRTEVDTVMARCSAPASTGLQGS